MGRPAGPPLTLRCAHCGKPASLTGHARSNAIRRGWGYCSKKCGSAGIAAAVRDRVVSQESRARMSASHLGLKHSAETRARIGAAQKRLVAPSAAERMARMRQRKAEKQAERRAQEALGRKRQAASRVVAAREAYEQQRAVAKCASKVRLESPGAAERYLVRVYSRTAPKMRVYQCRICDGWHVTQKPQTLAEKVEKVKAGTVMALAFAKALARRAS